MEPHGHFVSSRTFENRKQVKDMPALQFLLEFLSLKTFSKYRPVLPEKM